MKKRPENGTAQSEKFADIARQLSADEDEAAFKAKLGVIARQNPKDGPKPIPKKKSDR